MPTKVYQHPPNKYATGPMVWHPTTSYNVQDADPKHKNAPMIKSLFLMDTGAFMSSVPKRLGTEMGFAAPKPNEKQHIMLTAGGEIPYYSRQMNLKIQNHPSVAVPVAWLQRDPPTGPTLGRRGITDRFDIMLSERKNTLQFYPRDASTWGAAEVRSSPATGSIPIVGRQ
eukprot:PhM_4_TR12451/c0_g1_i1/m.26466